MKFFYTTGCNIPVFVAGFPRNQIKAVATGSKGYSFAWKNFYDPDDPLGWPIKNLSPSYTTAVSSDKRVNVGNLAQMWNLACHTEYWGDPDVWSR